MQRDLAQMNYRERMAFQKQIRYVWLGEGNIGLISNGAGMCMAMADLLDQIGGKATNFCDLGGSTYHEKFMHALLLMQADPLVSALYINMFCGHI